MVGLPLASTRGMAQSNEARGTSQLSPAEVENTADRFHGLVRDVVSQVCNNTGVRSVFGEPVTRGDVTIIPVASVYAGFGAGLGLGSHEGSETDAGKGGGMGIGAGYVTQPWGVWEITKHGARFRRSQPQGALATLIELAISLARGALTRRRL